MAISSNGAVLARLAGGLYNQTLSNATYNEIVATVKTSADVNTFANDLYSRDFGTKTDLAVAKTLVSNLGLSSITGLDNWVSAQLTAAGAANKGAKIVSLLNDLSNLTSDATYGSYASAFNAKTDAALALSQKAGSAGGDFNAAATLAAAQAAADAAAAAAKAAADAAAKAAADKAAADAAVVPKSLALTTDIDSVVGGDGADTITAVSAAIQAGDIVKGGAGNDILSWTANGAAGAVEMSAVETLNARLLASSSIDLTLTSGLNTVSVGSNSVAATTLTATGADFSTAFEMKPGAKTIGLNVTYLDASGTADTAKVTLGGLGTSSSTTGGNAAVTINGAVEGVALTTSGTNYVTLTGSTSTKTVTATGTGNNYITLGTSATSTTVDASANTGKLSLNIGSGLSAGDVIKGGAGTADVLTAVISSTAALTPTISGVETLALTTTAAANVDFKNITGVTAVTLAETSVAERLSNVPSTVTSVSLQEDATSANTVRIDYVAKAAATLAANFAPSALATTAVTYGDVTLSNVADVTLSASGSYGVTIGDVALGTAATALTVKTTAADGDFETGDLTGKSIESVTISATNGDITIGDVVNENANGDTTVKTLAITATGGAAVSTNNFDFYTATSGTADGENDSALKSISISAGADSVISIGDITAADDADNTDEGSAVSITASFGDNTDGSVVGDIAVVAASKVSITLDNNAGEVAFGYVEATAGDIDSVTLSVGSDATLLLDGGFWAYAGDVDGTNADGNIGDVSITVGQGGSIDAGANNDPEVWAEGTVGNVTVSADRNANIYFLDITSVNDSIGDVTVTVARGGDVAIDDVTADANLGNVSITTTDSGVYTGDFTATNGDIGNITLVSGTSGEINSSFTAGASIGDVSITSKASDDITLEAADSLGNVTASVTAGDLLTLDITATDASNITVSGAGDLDLTVTSSTAGNITVTSSNTDATVGLSVDLSGVTIAGVVSVTGGAGADTILGAPTANTLNGGTGADSIVGGDAADTISAGTGNDTVTGGLGGDAINVGTGTDTVIYATMTASSNVAKASALSGTITISSAFDILTGMGNGDIIDASAADANDDTTNSTSLLTSTATNAMSACVRGKYDATAGTWVAGTTDSTYNDYIIQWSDGTKITSILAVDIVGTVTMTDLLGVYTLTVV